jgi:hypothetical protein
LNEFWRFLDKVYPDNNLYNPNGCARLEDIKSFVENAKIAITDMVEETIGESYSMDQNMNWTRLNSKLKEQIAASEVEKTYFTSSAGKNSALSLFKKWLKVHRDEFGIIRIPPCREWRSKGYEIDLLNRKIQLEQLFSPSPTARRSQNRVVEFNEWLLSNPDKSFDDFRVYWYKLKLPQLIQGK